MANEESIEDTLKNGKDDSLEVKGMKFPKDAKEGSFNDAQKDSSKDIEKVVETNNLIPGTPNIIPSSLTLVV